MTMQEMYSKVKAAINAQGAPSMLLHSKQCLYRGPNGRKCAIGWLIPDDQYHPSIEGTAISEQPGQFSLPEKYFVTLQNTGDAYIPISFLQRLQRAHDCSALKDNFLQTFNTYMAVIASTYGLKDE